MTYEYVFTTGGENTFGGKKHFALQRSRGAERRSRINAVHTLVFFYMITFSLGEHDFIKDLEQILKDLASGPPEFPPPESFSAPTFFLPGAENASL